MKDKQITLETSTESFFKVFDWMYQGLGLTGNELITYAVIYDFAKRFQNPNPSVEQIASRTGVTVRTIQNVLRTFERRKLVYVERVPGCSSTYSLNEDFINFGTPEKVSGVKNEDPRKSFMGTPEKVSPHPRKSFTTPMKSFHPTPEKFSPTKRNIKETKEREESLRNKAGAHACASADSEKNLSQTPTDYDTECLNIFWKLYPETRKKTIDSIRDDFLAIPSTEYPLLLTVLHHKLFDSELGDEWRRQDGRFIPGIKRYLSDQYWKKEDNRCLEMWEYTPEGIEMNKSTPEDLQSQLSQNLKELRVL